MNIYIKGLRMVIDGAGPGVRRLLRLCRSERTGKRDRLGYPEIVREYTDLFKDIGPDRLVTMTGLLPRIQKWSGGRNAHIVDLRPPLPRITLPDDVEWRPRQKDACERLLGTHQGLMVYPTGFGKTFILEQLCRALRDYTVVVCTTRSTVLKELYDRIMRTTGRKPRKVSGSSDFKPGYGLYVVSDRSLHKLPDDWEPDVFIFDEAHGAVARTVFDQMRRFKTCRMYGFTATDEGRSDGADLGIEALFGERIGELGYAEACDLGLVAPMHAYFIDVSGQNMDRLSDSSLAYYGYVMNGERNERMLAGAKAMYDCGYHKQLFTTRTTEHTLLLSAMDPGIVPVYRPVTNEQWARFTRAGLVDSARHSQSPDISGILDAVRKGTVHRIAGTTCLRDGVDIKDLNVVVRMDGLSGKISNNQFSGRGTRTGKSHGLLLDASDRFGDRMRRAAERRAGLYHEMGWSLYTWDLVSRPEIMSYDE